MISRQMLSPYKPVCIISISFVRRTKQNAFLSVSGFLDALLHLRFLSTLPASYPPLSGRAQRSDIHVSEGLAFGLDADSLMHQNISYHILTQSYLTSPDISYNFFTIPRHYITLYMHLSFFSVSFSLSVSLSSSLCYCHSKKKH